MSTMLGLVSLSRDRRSDTLGRLNLGRGRTVPPETEHFYVHHSVKMREDAKNLPGGPYKPKAKFGDLQPIYVD